jgi:hypothetical protein
MSQKVKIHTVHGGDDRNMLLDCYFLSAGHGEYNFYSKDQDPRIDPPLAAGVSQTHSFSFKLGEFHWTVDGRTFLISDTAAHGDWKNTDRHADDGDGESGTFTAQAGGSLEETASYATA